ncbi:DUF5691 domain-containing protein [Oryzibacter oryziterrae]|uniref:DUF5691 domain-containing protein n=1 Tax=Oryzibacter oryziterrae TaxID=2766474 RepID=UPI001F37FBEA|nr:DUF5691 domain-containing protein [Oryzibacter oryziterrae]
MKTSGLKSDVFSAFLLGTSRRRPDYARTVGAPLAAGDPKADLKAMALLAQILRLERPAAPHEFLASPGLSGKRKVIPDDLRDRFIRLFGAGKFAFAPTDPLSAGMAQALDRLFLAPHPYDFQRLEGFVRTHADRLGADAVAWLDRDKSAEERRGYFDLAVLNDDNWSYAAPTRRERYIGEKRATDPSGARALIEAVWATEAADMRLRLLAALRTGLSADDQPFLEGLSKDRAPKVRDLAASFLARVAGVAVDRPAHKETLGRITKETKGIFRKRSVLKLELPATVIDLVWLHWVMSEFSEIPIESCAAQFDMSVSDLVDAAADDARLPAAIALMAAQSRRFDIVAQLAKASNHPVALLSSGGFSRGQDFTPAEALTLAETIVRSGANSKFPALNAFLSQLYALTGCALAPTAFQVIADATERQWSEGTLREMPGIVASLALLAPPSNRETVRFLALSLEEGGGSVIAWLDLLGSLEKVSSNE